MAELNKVLPAVWSHGNPIDIIGDAPPEASVRASYEPGSFRLEGTGLRTLRMSTPVRFEPADGLGGLTLTGDGGEALDATTTATTV